MFSTPIIAIAQTVQKSQTEKRQRAKFEALRKKRLAEANSSSSHSIPKLTLPKDPLLIQPLSQEQIEKLKAKSAFAPKSSASFSLLNDVGKLVKSVTK